MAPKFLLASQGAPHSQNSLFVLADKFVCKMRSCTGLAGVTNLDRWEVKVDGKVEVLGETEEKVESLYLLVNYAFKK